MDMRHQIADVYAQNYGTFLRTAYNVVKDHHGAEDVVQEAFCRALKYYPIQFDVSLDKWINTIVYRAALDYKHKERLCGMSEENEEEATEELEADAFVKEMYAIVLREIEAVRDETERTALRAYFIHEWTPAEIAEFVDMSPNKVSKTVTYFKAAMKEKYDEDMRS